MQGGPLEELLKTDPRYTREAYCFVMDALAYTVQEAGERRHVTGRELCFGIRDLALDTWGPLARHVFDAWGIRSTDDFGHIVFNLVGCGMLSKTDEDSLDDFRSVFRFDEAFRKGWAPELDGQGHVRRKRPGLPLRAWTTLYGGTEAN